METFKSGFVSIIGRTNVGKSTLINSLAETKIAATANKPQTTRNAIRAIINRENSQIIFIDTPGIHKPKTKLGNVMVDTAFGTISDVDVILFMIEATSDNIGKGDSLILEKLKQSKKKAILLINKIDLVEKEKLLKLIELYSKEYTFEAILPISADKSDGLQDILIEIEKLLPNGPKYYADDEYTDQNAKQIVAEIIREKALKFLDEEIPHGIYIEIEKMKKSKTKMNENIYNIESTIYCNKDSHKGIIIGRNGQMLKKIGQYARLDIEEMLRTKVNLKIWVKVNKDWQNDEKIAKKYGIK